MSTPGYATRRGIPRLPPMAGTQALMVAGAMALGALAGLRPAAAVGALALGLVVALAFVTPVAHLTLLVAVTAIVPYDLQNAISVGGGGGSPGLLPTDLLLVTGLARAILVLARRPLERRRGVAVAMCLVLLALVMIQVAHGWVASPDHSQVGFEGRVLLGWGTLLIAMPLVADPVTRRRLLKGLVGVGLLLGTWGLAQWVVDLPFGSAGDAGVRAGVSLTSAGRGQVQGGLFGFPIALLIALAVLISGQIASLRVRLVLVAVIVLNGLSDLLTFERTFWVATLLGAGLVALKAGRLGRLQALIAAVGVIIIGLPILSTIAPGALTTARERLLSLGQYGTDSSVRFRIVETRHVNARIADQPVLGSGLGATIFWGRPYEQVPATATPFSHNALLWLWWKLGIAGPLIILALVGWAIAVRAPPLGGALFKAVRDGAQAGLLVMLAVSVTFPSFAQRPITPTLGVLAAICLAPLLRDRDAAGATA